MYDLDVGSLMALVSTLSSREKKIQSVEELPRCQNCGIELKPLEQGACPDCEGPTLLLECPSCLDEDELHVHVEGRSTMLLAVRHMVHDDGGLWTSDAGIAVFVRIPRSRNSKS